jgi:hypothetical protein
MPASPCRRFRSPARAGSALPVAAALALLAPFAPAFAPEAAAQAPDPTAIAAGLPDGRVVLERAVDAMGGQEAFDAVESLAMQLVIGLPNGELAMEALSMGEDRLSLRLKASLDRRVEALMIKNTDVAWMTMQPLDEELAPVGEPQLLPQIPTRELREFGSAVRAHWMILRMLEDYETIRSTEITQFEEQAALKIRIADPRTERGKAAAPGDRFLYISLADGMPLGIDAPVQGPDAPRQVLAFKDVVQFGDLRLWTRMVGTRGPLRQSFVFKDIVFNAVPKQAFAVPEAVKAREAAAPSRPVNPAAPVGTPGGG